jgi:SAM-dependent methyltransferase
MSAQPDYFSNHALKLRFPWRLYHGPIVAALQRAVTLSPGAEVLNLGSGPFFELRELDGAGRRFTACDIDPRAIALAREQYGAQLAGADVAEPGRPLPYPDARFDLVVSMDVIEHVPEPVAWVSEALRVLKPHGLLFLTTPNYASTSLRWIENTALEAVARFQGFSRRDIHPTKMTPARLADVLASVGAAPAHIESLAFGWVLAAYARKQSG